MLVRLKSWKIARRLSNSLSLARILHQNKVTSDLVASG